MARNKSEKLPPQSPDVDPDFYKLLRIYAANHVERGTPTLHVRDNIVRWGQDSPGVYDLFTPWARTKKERWYNWSIPPKRAYIADYMDYLYGAQ